MNRTYLTVVSLAVVPFLSTFSVKARKKKRPNILFCIADDAGHMSAYGYKWLHTPSFDRVAKEGVLFNNAFTCNAKSAPSRAAIITGRNSWQLEEACNHWPLFPSKFKSYPEALAENGYIVGCTGKGWGPGIAKDINGKRRNITGTPWNRRKAKPPTTGISKNDYAANFSDFMKQRDPAQPFCFWYGALEPHRGYEYGSSRRFGKELEVIDSIPSYWPDVKEVRRDLLDYAVEIEHFDRHLGRILKILEESGELENTLIIVTSDHNMPFPRCKGQEYFHSNHIPMAIMWPNKLKKKGRKIEAYVSVIDLAPTILEATGLSASDVGMKEITGRSLIKLLMNKKEKLDRDYVLIGKERHDVGRPNDQGYPIRGLIRGDYLYLRNFKPDRWPAGNPETGYMNVDGSPTKTAVLNARRKQHNPYYWKLSFGKRQAEELYNIKQDPNCMHNLVGITVYQELREQLEHELFQRLLEEGDPRMYHRGDIFDEYPDVSGANNFWNRTKAGEKVPFGWVNKSDFETE